VKTQRAGDIASGIFLSLLGVVVVVAALRIKGAPDVRMHPRTLPLILGWTLGIAGGLLALRAWRYHGADRGVDWPDRAGALRVLITLAGLAALLLFLEPLGLPLGTALLVGCLVWYQGGYRLMTAGLLGLATGGTIYLVFIRLLQLSFPAGPLGR
jgi:putative tricarboxylic transport membrane protein